MRKKYISLACAVFLLIGFMSGCEEQKSTTLVNTLTFDTDAIKSLHLDYDADNIYVLKSDNDKIILKEYMNADKIKYYAQTSIQDNELLITEGNRPRFTSFESYVEIYLPQNYTSSITLHSTSGTIDSEIPISIAGDFCVDTTSGTATISNIQASKISGNSTNGSLSLENIDSEEINIQTANASTSMNRIYGSINYQSKSGELTASNLYGSGSFSNSEEGSIDVSFADANNNISAYSKNGVLLLSLPSKLSFNFTATTKEGSIETSFDDQLMLTDNMAAGIIGSSSGITVELETRNGNIQVTRLPI